MDKHFTVIVVGDNPQEIMKKYDSSLKVEPYVVYEFSKIKEYKKNYINSYEFLLKSKGLPDYLISEYQEKVNEFKNMDDIDFYCELTNDFTIDQETGNAITDINPNGKYTYCRIGKDLAMPLINKNGEEIFQCKKKDIDWNKIHLAKQDIYIAAWEMIMENRIPKTDEEKIIYENMKNRTEYFKFYSTKENYVISSTAFWGYAFVNEEKWVELEDNIDEISWVSNFYNNFIKDLPDNSLISVYECFKK